VANCAVCHADQGVGGVDSPGSDDGTVPAVNPIDPGFITGASGDAAIFARDLDVFVQHGSRPSGKDPQIVMPAWGDHGLLSHDDIADIAAYVMELNRVFWPDRCPGIRLKLGNPSAAAFLQTGSPVVQGTAVDTRATHPKPGPGGPSTGPEQSVCNTSDCATARLHALTAQDGEPGCPSWPPSSTACGSR
jgi:cbb3-type cytochrome c oxidase subunit III